MNRSSDAGVSTPKTFDMLDSAINASSSKSSITSDTEAGSSKTSEDNGIKIVPSKTSIGSSSSNENLTGV